MDVDHLLYHFSNLPVGKCRVFFFLKKYRNIHDYQEIFLSRGYFVILLLFKKFLLNSVILRFAPYLLFFFYTIG